VLDAVIKDEKIPLKIAVSLAQVAVHGNLRTLA
jgi:hypothetical protein